LMGNLRWPWCPPKCDWIVLHLPVADSWWTSQVSMRSAPVNAT